MEKFQKYFQRFFARFLKNVASRKKGEKGENEKDDNIKTLKKMSILNEQHFMFS